MAGQSYNSLPRGCMVGFAMPFVLVGVAATGFLYWSTYRACQAQSWVEVPATILSASVKTHRGGDSTTYSVETRYRYDFEGKTYHSDRVSFSPFTSDGDRNWHRAMVRRLKKHASDKTPYPCFVDPAAPENAVLERGARFSLMLLVSVFGLAFGGAGIAMLTLDRNPGWQEKRLQMAQASGQMWRVRSDWEAGEIRLAPLKRLRYLLPCLVLLSILALPTILLLPQEFQRESRWAYLGLIGPFAIAITAVKVFTAVWHQIRRGVTRIQLATVPGVIGGPVTGIIHSSRKLNMPAGVRVTLRCDRATRDSSETRSIAITETCWQDEQTILIDLKQSDANESAVPFDFVAPFDLPDSAPLEDEKVDWILTAKGLAVGSPLDITCEVPVYRTVDSSEDLKRPESLVADFSGPDQPDDILLELGVRAVDGGVRKRWWITGQKTLSGILTLLVFAGGFDLAAFLVFRYEGPWFIGVILGLIGFPLTLGFIHTMLWRCRIETASGMVRIRSGMIPLARWKNIPLDDFDRLSIRQTTRVNEKTYHEVYFQARNRKPITVGKGIYGKHRTLQYAAALWRQVIGSEPPEIKTRSFGDNDKT
ncbi:hypothetical protein CA51_35840 [Rosistilla oblonga]|uniref:DUF3592 domain-containing protein n=1 Tax=Rosistilla oblonga TaxID=2527990 RepID=UPI00118D5593|nr:DUF3592 domain-containing protein [Rosistilla oblonga]QDV13693.1 hypothetical protein CA51_35840 [Rosistilla oblonga]